MQRLEVKLGGLERDGKSFTGYGAIFNSADQGGDVIAKGAFAASIARHKADGTMPAMLWQHDPNKPIGVWEEMAEDDRGLAVKGSLVTETPDGAAAAALIAAGALGGLSIGYRTKRAEARGGGGRNLLEVDVWEVSPVTFPMHRQAKIDQKMIGECGDLKSCEGILREAGFSHSAAKSFVSRIKSIDDEVREGRQAVDRIRDAAKRFGV